MSELAVALEFVAQALKEFDETSISNMKELDNVIAKIDGLKGLSQILKTPEKFAKVLNEVENSKAKPENTDGLRLTESKLRSIDTAIQKATLDLQKFKEESLTTKGQTVLDNITAKFKKLENELRNNGNATIFNKKVSELFEPLKSGKYNKTNRYRNVIAEIVGGTNIAEAASKIESIVGEYKKAKKILETPIDDKGMAAWKYQIIDAEGNIKTLAYTFDSTTGTIREKVNKVTTAMSPLGEFADKVKMKWKDMGAYLLSFASFYQVVGIFKQGVAYVRELDKALTEFQVVTNATKTSLDSMRASARQTAHTVGTSASEILASATDWRRLGYSAKESLELSESAAKYAAVGFTDVDSATKSLVSSLQAYYADAGDVAAKADEVVDKFVAVGNNLPITSAEIGQGMENAGAVLKVAGNDINETIGMLAAANSTMQDISTVASSLRVLSMRLRGTSASELEKAGEDTEGLIEDASKLYDTIKNLTKTDKFEGVSILTDTGSYKSTYEILLGIANVWSELTDDKKSALLEAIAGKTRAAAAATILENPELLKKGYETAADSMDASAQAMDIAMNQIDKKLAQLKENWQELWQDTVGSDLVKNLVDTASGVVKITNKIGGLNTALMVTAGILSAKANVGRGNYISYLVEEAHPIPAATLNEDNIQGYRWMCILFILTHRK